MASSRYWCIHYGPDSIDDEAFNRAATINHSLRKVIQKVHGAVGCKAHIISEDVEDEKYGKYAHYHVKAIFDVGGDMTESQLREHLIAECAARHAIVIRDECRFEALSELVYSVQCAVTHLYIKC